MGPLSEESGDYQRNAIGQGERFRFNGAALRRERRRQCGGRRRRAISHRFNGAALRRERRRNDYWGCRMRSESFNGAALRRERRPFVACVNEEPVRRLQWGRSPKRAETIDGSIASLRALVASMGPLSEESGDRRTFDRPARLPSRFNGAALRRERRPLNRLENWRMSGRLQWGRSPKRAETPLRCSIV